eukprot:scaffold3835_cov11472-Pavlova_lutheri.AAC.2
MPLTPWATHVLQWPGQRDATLQRLQLACMKSESLVIAGQQYGGESVPGPCTHRPSHHGSWPRPTSLP